MNKKYLYLILLFFFDLDIVYCMDIVLNDLDKILIFKQNIQNSTLIDLLPHDVQQQLYTKIKNCTSRQQVINLSEIYDLGFKHGFIIEKYLKS